MSLLSGETMLADNTYNNRVTKAAQANRSEHVCPVVHVTQPCTAPTALADYKR